MRVQNILIVSTVSVGTVCASAQQPPARDTLNPIVITASRVSVSLPAPLATTTVLHGAALRDAGITRLVDALRLVPGLSLVTSGATGAQTSLFVRGGNSNFVRLLIDGVAVNDAGGAVDLASMTTDNIERVEIVRGPASVLYGSDAIAGVIQLFTRSGRGPLELHGEAGTGSNQRVRGAFGVSGGGPRAGVSLEAAHDATAGILAFNNRYTNDLLSAKLLFRPSLRTDAAVAARWSGSDYHYPTDFSGAVVDHNSEQLDHRFVVSVDAGQRLSDRVELRLLLASHEYLPRTNDGPDTPADTLGFYGFFARGTRARRSADARINVRAARGSVITLGAEAAHDRERSRSLSLSQYGNDDGTFAADRHNGALYGQVIGTAASRFSYSLGARLDDNSAFGTFRTARAALGVSLSPWSSARISFGNAFKAPGFFENFAAGFVRGNPALRPERSTSVELGYDAHSADGLSTFGVAAFDQTFRDLIDYASVVAPGSPNYFNVGVARARGLEVRGMVQAGQPTSWTWAWTWLDARTTHPGFDTTATATYVQGSRLVRRPAQTLALGLLHRWNGGAHLDLAASRIGARDDRDFRNYPGKAVELPGYLKVDAALSVPFRALGGSARLLVRVENALGARYEEVLGFAAPGRTLYAALRW